MKWNSYKGGQRWAVIDTGEIVCEDPPTGDLTSEFQSGFGHKYRTKGDPITAWNAVQDYGAAINHASLAFNIPPRVIFAMMAIEARRNPKDRSHLDPRSCREEDGYISDSKTPHRVSPGLMQTLLSTAQEANETYEIYKTISGKIELLEREDLFIPERSIALGAAYMRTQIDRKEPDESGFADDDPLLLCAAYNAGSVRETSKNPWHLMTYGGDRMDRFIAFNNDFVSLLRMM